jgi:hypothetical protein
VRVAVNRPVFGNDRSDLKAVERGADAENPLHDGVVVPRRRAGEPGVLGLAEGGRILAGDHLRVDIGLAAVQIADLFARRGIDAAVVVVGQVAVAQTGFADHDPGIDVAEDAGVLLVSRRIGGDFAHFDVVVGVGRLLDHDAVLGGQMLAHGGQGLGGLAVLQADAGQGAVTIGLDVDFALGAFLGADLAAKVVISAQEPLAVPAMLENDGFHFGGFSQIGCGFGVESAVLGDGGELAAGLHKEAGDEDRFGHLAVLVGGGLEGLARRIGEAVEIEAVVPVGAADERQAVRPKALQGVVEAALQVLVERHFRARLVVVGHRLVEDAPVAGLFEIGRDADDEPVGIVVEAAADVVVAALGERLVLVIGAAGGQLRCGQVEDALAGARRNHVDEAEQVLVGVAEAKAAADAGLIERRRARHVEGRHALVGVPDVHHAVGVDVGGVHLEDAEGFHPVLAQALEGRVSLFGVEIFGDDRLDRGLVDGLRAGRVEFLIDGILVVAEHEDDLAGLAGLQFELDLVGADGRPAVSDGVGELTGFDGGRLVPAAIAAQEGFALGVESRAGLGTGKVREVIAALAVLRLVINHAVFHFHLSGVEVALEVGAVVLGVPEAELDLGEAGNGGLGGAAVGDRELPNLEVLAQRDKVAGVRLDAGVLRSDDGVAHAVAAGVVLELVACGLPGGRPEFLRLVVAQVDVAPAEIERHVVVAVARDPAQAGVAIERVASRGIGNNAEIRLASQVVDPWQRRVRLGDHILAIPVVEISELHNQNSLDTEPAPDWQPARKVDQSFFQSDLNYFGGRIAIILDAARV